MQRSIQDSPGKVTVGTMAEVPFQRHNRPLSEQILPWCCYVDIHGQPGHSWMTEYTDRPCWGACLQCWEQYPLNTSTGLVGFVETARLQAPASLASSAQIACEFPS